jgi:hypothetical protein
MTMGALVELVGPHLGSIGVTSPITLIDRASPRFRVKTYNRFSTVSASRRFLADAENHDGTVFDLAEAFAQSVDTI